MSAFRIAIAVGALLLAGGPTAHAQSAASFYAGKTLKYIVPDGAGGGYDAYSRLLVRHLADHIPGHPRIVAENMPGAAGLIATNWLYRVAARDGSVMGSTYNALLTDMLLGDSGAQFDPTKFKWIGSIASQYSTCMVWQTSPIRSIEDARSHQVRVSTTGFTGNSAKLPLMLNKLLGTRFNVIAGYASTGMRLAVERGEVDGICGLPYDTYAATEPEWLTDPKIRFILQTGFKRAKALPDVPLLVDYVTDPTTRAALNVLSIDEVAGRPVLFPPGVPDGLVEALRAAFDETMQDPKFLADAERMRIDLQPLTGQEVEREIAQAYAAPSDIIMLAALLWGTDLQKGDLQKR